jgi:NADH-quinone oxidoreductase subunit C
MFPEHLREIPMAAALESGEPGAIVCGKLDRGELTLEISPARIAAVCRYLKESWQFARLTDVTAVDWHPQEPRFEVVYHLHSVERNERLRLKCRLPGEAPQIDSVTGVWRSANWYEREIFDLFGIGFRNHPNLRRILLPEDWEGHPLRRDYPIHGYKYSYKDE